ncbi:MAG: hypothetical protein V1848_03120 [Candidatus Magasanikbacteria bacterium]
MSVLTALLIQLGAQSLNIRCECWQQHPQTGKFAGAVLLYRQGVPHALLLLSPHQFSTPEQSVAHMEGVVQEICSLKLLNAVAIS